MVPDAGDERDLGPDLPSSTPHPPIAAVAGGSCLHCRGFCRPHQFLPFQPLPGKHSLFLPTPAGCWNPRPRSALPDFGGGIRAAFGICGRLLLAAPPPTSAPCLALGPAPTPGSPVHSCPLLSPSPAQLPASGNLAF